MKTDIIRKISQLYSKWQLKRLSRTAVVFKNAYYVQYQSEGPKTYGYMNQWEAIRHAFNVIYITKNFMSSYVYGMNIKEDESQITLEISSPRPGLIIGKYGSCIDELMKTLTDVFGKKTYVDLKEIKTGSLYGRKIYENY